MTPHDHTTIVPGCFRCELGRDEAMDTMRAPADALCEVCGDAAYYVLSDETLNFCADCAVGLLSEEARRLHDQVAGLTRHRDGCVANLEATRAYAEEVAAAYPAAVTPRRIIAILDRNAT